MALTDENGMNTTMLVSPSQNAMPYPVYGNNGIKSIDTINAMQREGYSNRYMRDNNDNNSYNSYNNYGGNSNRGGSNNSYDRSYNSYDDGYSRNDMNEEIRSRLAKMLERANNDSDRDAIRRTMNMM